MIYKVDFEGQACKQIKEKAESYQYDLKSVLKGIGLLIADMWLPGDSKPQINTWEGLFEKVQEDYSYKDTKRYSLHIKSNTKMPIGKYGQ